MSNYTPPKVWQWENQSSGNFSNINRPTAGPTHDKQLPTGKHPHQLYSLGTPNGNKVTIMFEELLHAGHQNAEYDAFYIDIMEGDQFSSGFVEINPNSKIPAMLDTTTSPPTPIFESGAILLYLAEKFNAFIPTNTTNPTDPLEKTQCLSWLFWQMGAAPYLGGGFGHFYAYAPEKFEYPINRFTMETKRQLNLLDKHLKDKTYIAANQYTIADIAIFPWYGELVLDNLYDDAAQFLNVAEYPHLIEWAQRIANRPAVKRGRIVNRTWGEPQLRERHSASDFPDSLND